MSDKVLVVYSSKYGATTDIAEKIGEVLQREGLEVDVTSSDRAGDPAGYQAVVMGSAVYVGKWRKEAAKFLKNNKEVLAGLPVWIFSSGPSGEGEPVELTSGWKYPKSLEKEIEFIKPRDIKLFSGNVDPEKLSGFSMWIMKRVKAPSGDYRDWDDIIAWASDIARSVSSQNVDA